LLCAPALPLLAPAVLPLPAPALALLEPLLELEVPAVLVAPPPGSTFAAPPLDELPTELEPPLLSSLLFAEQAMLKSVANSAQRGPPRGDRAPADQYFMTSL
jgi:hypothetical protein